MRKLTSEDFQEAISNGITLVKFGAPWCGPCRAMQPILIKVEQEIGDSALVVEVDVEDEQELAQELQIQSLPTILIYHNGAEVNRLYGNGHSSQELVMLLKQASGE